MERCDSLRFLRFVIATGRFRLVPDRCRPVRRSRLAQECVAMTIGAILRQGHRHFRVSRVQNLKLVAFVR